MFSQKSPCKVYACHRYVVIKCKQSGASFYEEECHHTACENLLIMYVSLARSLCACTLFAQSMTFLQYQENSVVRLIHN